MRAKYIQDMSIAICVAVLTMLLISGNVQAVSEDLTVQIDIKPGDFPNSINLGSKGNIPVAILGSPTFDAVNINPNTVTLAGAPVKMNKNCKSLASFEDINNDGFKDMIVHIDTHTLQLTSESTDATLTGRTSDGKYIKGTDSVKIVTSASNKVEYIIDSCIQPVQSDMPGLNHGPSRPVGVVINPDNNRDEFVSNEVIFYTERQDNLNAFIAKYGGTILRESPNPVSDVGKWYLINVDPKLSSLNDLASNMETLGFKGYFTFSSEEAARLSALVAREINNGAGPNFLMRPQVIPEHPDGSGGNIDAEQWEYMREDSDISVGVIHAWEYLRYKGIPSIEEFTPIKIAIIDSGFALDETTGKPLNNNIDYENSLEPPWQLDLVDRDQTAGGINHIACNGGEQCAPWHGQGSFGIAAAYPRNSFGSAGTGAEIVEPMIIRIDGSFYIVGDAIYWSLWHGAKVISASFIGECNWWCRTFSNWDSSGLTKMKIGIDWAIAKKAIFVTAAGNAGKEISNTDWLIPCVLPNVICVGSVNNYNRYNLYNYGLNVDIWAPTGLYSTVNPDTANNAGIDALEMMGGTSASTPFVAGIAALMKALDPSLDTISAGSIIIDTANPSPDSKVKGIIDAYKAVNRVSPNKPPVVEIIQPLDGSSVSYKYPVSLGLSVNDPEPNPSREPILLGWSSNIDGDLCTGGTCSVKLQTGTHTITARAIDPFGAIGTDSITVNVVNSPPFIDITRPEDGSTFYSSQEISFYAYTYDVDQASGLSISWKSDIDGPLGTGPSIRAHLSAGTHTITATVKDEKGLTTQDRITVRTLLGDGYPTARILSPEDYSTFGSVLKTFNGEGIDPEEGTLSGEKLEWYSDKDGFLGTGNTIQKVLSTIPPEQCSGTGGSGLKTHVITLKVTDSDGHEAIDKITVYVGSVEC